MSGPGTLLEEETGGDRIVNSGVEPSAHGHRYVRRRFNHAAVHRRFVKGIKNMKTLSAKSKMVLILALVLIGSIGAAQTAFAQTTVFAYQGRLELDGVPANGDYDFQFKLFDAANGGAQQGSTLEQLNITVANGAFTVNLDFGAAVFSGADRFLEVSARPAGSGAYATITPCQFVTSTPYSIRSLRATTSDGLSATCAGCVTSSQIQNVQGSQVAGNVAGSQISGTIPVTSVPAGSSNYIQNATSQQPNSNFNISGNGTAGGSLQGSVVNALTHYNLGGLRVLTTAGLDNLVVGLNAGNVNTGSNNSFVGSQTGRSNTTGFNNSFFGRFAGLSNTTGSNNSLFGKDAGGNNVTGSNNAFFGTRAGNGNTTGGFNSFFGDTAGRINTTGHSNSFFGRSAGENNTTGADNSFLGLNAGLQNTTGSGNTFVGVGSGTQNAVNPTGDNNTALGFLASVDSGVNNSTAIGTNASAVASHTIVLGTTLETVMVRGKLQVDTLASAGNQQLCMNNSNRIAPCSSSLRYKTDLRPFASGMSIINRLQPVTFSWKDGGMRDVGFGAEDVHQIEPLLVTYNAQGLVEGVKYDRVTVALVNALKEHQQQIASQQSQIEGLKAIQAENDKLKAQLAGILARLQQIERAQALDSKSLCAGWVLTFPTGSWTR
jgi:hypothetical protein